MPLVFLLIQRRMAPLFIRIQMEPLVSKFRIYLMEMNLLVKLELPIQDRLWPLVWVELASLRVPT